MSYEVTIVRGDARHLGGPVDTLLPLDEAAVREGLRSPPADVEVHGGDADEVLWAGDDVIVHMLLVRSDDGTLRAVEAGVKGGGAGGEAEYAAVLRRLLDLAERLGGDLYEPGFGRRVTRGRIAELGAERPPVPPPPPPEPRLLVDFAELTDEEAEAYRDRHAARADDAVADFRHRAATLGGPSQAELDATPDSLVGLADWLFDTLPGRYAGLRARTADEQLRHGGMVLLTIDEWRRLWPDEPRDLPPWCAPGAQAAHSPLPPTGLWLADGLGFYFAACLAREVDGLGWRVYRAPSRRLRDVDENHTVLATPHGTWNAHGVAYVVLLRALALRARRGHIRDDVYRYARTTLRPGRDA